MPQGHHAHIDETKLHVLIDDAKDQLLRLGRDELDSLSGRQRQRPLLGNGKLRRTRHRHGDLVGGPRLLATLLSGRPVMIVTGHFGNWELAGYVLGLVGFKTYAIARTLDNPYVDELLRSLRERGAAIPAVVITADTRRATHDAAMRMGVSAYLEKPVSRRVLTAAIREAISKSRDQ